MYVLSIFKSHVQTGTYINKAIQEKQKIVVEGANATMLDIDFGTYNITKV